MRKNLIQKDLLMLLMKEMIRNLRKQIVEWLSASKKENCYSVNPPCYPSEKFLSFCYNCKKNLGHGKDIYMYRLVGGGGGGGWARPCDSCHGAACAVYCQADSAYLCASCNGRIHAANQVASRHERVWVCEACEQAPLAFTCKADAANLFTTCDADIHSANPLARRHHRVPIITIHGCIFGPSAVTHVGRPLGHEDLLSTVEKAEEEVEKQEEEEDETESWLLLNPIKSNYQSSGFIFDGEVDEYLDFIEYNNSCSDTRYQDQYNHQQQDSFSMNQKRNEGNDSSVPVNGEIVKEQQQHEASKVGFSYTTTSSVSHSEKRHSAATIAVVKRCCSTND